MAEVAAAIILASGAFIAAILSLVWQWASTRRTEQVTAIQGQDLARLSAALGAEIEDRKAVLSTIGAVQLDYLIERRKAAIALYQAAHAALLASQGVHDAVFTAFREGRSADPGEQVRAATKCAADLRESLGLTLYFDRRAYALAMNVVGITEALVRETVALHDHELPWERHADELERLASISESAPTTFRDLEMFLREAIAKHAAGHSALETEEHAPVQHIEEAPLLGLPDSEAAPSGPRGAKRG